MKSNNQAGLGKRSKDGSIHVTDEKYNTMISALGAILGLIGSIVLVYESCMANKFWHIVSFSIYGFSLVTLFVASALHHGIDGSEKVNKLLMQFDYCAIYLMIAGTFTPICLIALNSPLSWNICYLNWTLAFIGIVLKMCVPHLPKWVTTFMYIGMGWLALVLAPPMLSFPQGQKIFWTIALGGFFFTFGAGIFHFEKPNPFPGKFGFHEIWHVFVLVASACHYAAMYLYILPL